MVLEKLVFTKKILSSTKYNLKAQFCGDTRKFIIESY